VALTDAQVVTLGEMILETPDATESALDGLAGKYSESEVNAIESAIAADIVTFAAIKDKRHIRLSGGRDGIDLNFERKEAALRDRNRKRLGLPDISYLFDPNAVHGATLRGPIW
jgi:hypothetical protein